MTFSMQTVMVQAFLINWAGRTRKMICYGCLTLIVMGGGWWAGAAQAQTVSCSINAPNLDFGSVDVLKAGTQFTKSAALKPNCAVKGFLPGTYGQLCFSIGAGSAGPGEYKSRVLQSVGVPAEKLNFDIYQDSGYTLVWGTQYDAASGNPYVVTFQVDAKGNATVSTTLTLYASLSPQQNKISGNYFSDFGVAGSTAITWTQLPGSTGDAGTCGTASAGAFGFTVKANVTSKCYFTAEDLNFGSYSSFAVGPIPGQSNINMLCNSGTKYQVGLDNGSNSTGGTNRFMKNAATGALVRYDLYRDAGRTLRWGNSQGSDTFGATASKTSLTIPVYGLAFPDSSVTAGDYADTVTVTVYY